ncbi:Protein tilB [Gryllus bimaculatus]|nr:Protein tilB [Gryllus bimaculatus]
MVRITEELVRKKSEHNEGEICTLEELSLHQENIEKIEHLQNWCRDLKILLFHSNLIEKIENINKMKRLEYLNLSLNNIERIENLEGCESLAKLDLTLNFVGELTSIVTLVNNIHLKTLYLTGNPCTDYVGYRDYVIATLPQLQSLDGTDIDRSERIKALQNHERIKKRILIEQEQYKVKRYAQKVENELKYSRVKKDIEEDEEKLSRFWQEPSDNSPETRKFIAEQSRRKDNKCDLITKTPKRVYNLFDKDGHPVNVNEARISFTFTESEDLLSFVLDISVYKHLDTTLLDVDVQPTYVRVTIKGKVLQLVLPDDVKTDSSTAQRSLTTGHLVITMPKVNGLVKQKITQPPPRTTIFPAESKPYSSKRELLEIGPAKSDMDFSRIVKNCSILKHLKESKSNLSLVSKKVTAGFIDDPTVPPLE